MFECNLSHNVHLNVFSGVLFPIVYISPRLEVYCVLSSRTGRQHPWFRGCAGSYSLSFSMFKCALGDIFYIAMCLGVFCVL